MPIYEYVCAACGNKSEHLMRMSDPDPTDCPECGKAALSKALSAPSFRLAGAGWYETDFKKDGDKKRNLVESSGGDSKSSDSKSSDSKPESKSDSSAAASPPAAAPAATPSSGTP